MRHNHAPSNLFISSTSVPTRTSARRGRRGWVCAHRQHFPMSGGFITLYGIDGRAPRLAPVLIVVGFAVRRHHAAALGAGVGAAVGERRRHQRIEPRVITPAQPGMPWVDNFHQIAWRCNEKRLSLGACEGLLPM